MRVWGIFPKHALYKRMDRLEQEFIRNKISLTIFYEAKKVKDLWTRKGIYCVVVVVVVVWHLIKLKFGDDETAKSRMRLAFL